MVKLTNLTGLSSTPKLPESWVGKYKQYAFHLLEILYLTQKEKFSFIWEVMWFFLKAI